MTPDTAFDTAKGFVKLSPPTTATLVAWYLVKPVRRIGGSLVSGTIKGVSIRRDDSYLPLFFVGGFVIARSFRFAADVYPHRNRLSTRFAPFAQSIPHPTNQLTGKEHSHRCADDSFPPSRYRGTVQPRTPGTLLAAMHMPIPVPQIKMPRSA